MAGLFDGKVVTVTGAGGAIGRAAALGFATEGAKVVVTDLNPETMQETVAQVTARGGTATGLAGDITVADFVRQFVDHAISVHGGLDCAFNNAGIVHPDDHAWDETAFRESLNINLVSQMLCMKFQIPEMLKRQKGAIVNTSSTQGLNGVSEPPCPGYTASKHGVIGLTKAAALEFAGRNIRVNALCPGVTRTAMVDQVMSVSEAVRERLLNYAPIGRLAEPEEIAEAAIWLCSDKASYMTGHALVADGGFTAQ